MWVKGACMSLEHNRGSRVLEGKDEKKNVIKQELRMGVGDD